MEDIELTGGAQAVDPAFVAAVAARMLLGVPAERLQLMAEAAAPVQEALRGLADVDLGETIPATSFDPSWDG